MKTQKELVRNLATEYVQSGCTFDGIAEMIMLRDERIRQQEELIRDLLPPRVKNDTGK